MASAQQKVRYYVRKGYKKETVEKIAKLAVDVVVARTLGSRDRYLKKFYKYTDEYAEEKGVGKTDVDLYLTGDMLGNLQVLQVTKDWFEIGYDKGYDGMGKVEGNRLGTYGNPSPVTRERDFLGLDDTELNLLMKEFPQSTIEEQDGKFDDMIDKVYRTGRSY